MRKHLLFTLQDKGLDISRPSETPTHGLGWIKYQWMSSFLNMTDWIWTLENIPDFYNKWFIQNLSPLTSRELWMLEVPDEAIIWIAHGLRRDPGGDVQNWIFPVPEDIRAMGDIPEGLVAAPVNERWILCRLPAEKVFALNTVMGGDTR